MHEHTPGWQIEPVADRDALRAQWQALADQLAPAFFLRWAWIAPWLNGLNGLSDLNGEPLRVSRVAQQEGSTREQALGLFCVREQRRHGLLRARTAWLHQSGEPARDQVWIEYNGLLAAPGQAGTHLSDAVAALLAGGHCEEMFLSMLPAAVAAPLLQGALAHVRCVQQVQGYHRNLQALRLAGQTVLQGLSANTRAQVRRSLRGYEQRYGKPQLHRAASTAEALTLFERAGEWHRARWADSGYNNPHFLAFHRELISRNVEQGAAALIELRFGQHSAGVFYYLLDERCAYFYLQGVQPEDDGRLKPGLTGHALIMQHFLDRGFDVYDFMGGDSQYKQQLADERTGFMSLHVHNGALKFRLEDAARRWRDRWRARRASTAPAPSPPAAQA